MTPTELNDLIIAFGFDRRSFANLLGYPIQTVHRWCTTGRAHVPPPAAMVALLLVLQDMPEDAREGAFAMLARHKLRNRGLTSSVDTRSAIQAAS